MGDIQAICIIEGLAVFLLITIYLVSWWANK